MIASTLDPVCIPLFAFTSLLIRIEKLDEEGGPEGGPPEVDGLAIPRSLSLLSDWYKDTIHML